MNDHSNDKGTSNGSSPATGINSSDAIKMFRDYHGIPLNVQASLASSSGKLTTWDGARQSPIQHFIVDNVSVILALKTKVEQANLHFMGLAGIPARNNEGDTFIFVAVVADDADGKNRRLFLPANSSELDFIFDYIETCPALCGHIQNQDQLWKDWLVV